MLPIYIAALFSGLLQALGYLVYIQKSLRHEVEPNPTTWFMFAYGTATLTVLEWDHQADWLVLILPVTCAILSLRVAAICLSQGKLKWPTSWLDRTAFLMDVSLTLAYITVWLANQKAFITESEHQALVLLFLILSNSSTLVSFIPIIRGTIKSPRNEHPLPWFIWMCAYSTLGYVTVSKYGLVSVFTIYPAMNAVLHGLVGLFALRRFAGKSTRS